MTAFTARSFAGEDDLQAICDLLNDCDACDRLDDNYSVDDLRQEFANPRIDLLRDLRLWEDAHGQVVGFGQIRAARSDIQNDSYIYFRVHPRARGRKIESEIIAWSEQRLHELAQEQGRISPLRSGTRDYDSYGLRILEQHGFTPIRYYFTMECPLDVPIIEPQLPIGFRLDYVTDERVAQWVDLYNESFVKHWNYRPMTVQDRQYMRNNPKYLAERDLVAVGPDGIPVALCEYTIDQENNQRNQCNDGWISLLGTRPGFRKIGLGRAMLLVGLQRLKAEGADTAKLGVDADNPTAALQLYESAGFRRSFTWIMYNKQL